MGTTDHGLLSSFYLFLIRGVHTSGTPLHNLSLVHPDFKYLTENATRVIQSVINSLSDELKCTQKVNTKEECERKK